MNLLDDRVTRIQVAESNEDLIAIPCDHPRIVLDKNVDLGYINEFIARETVVRLLITVASKLPEGVSLSIKEAYRPLSFQEFIFKRRAKRLSELPEHSHKSSQEIHELTAQFIAPPSVAGHPTGGAVDVSLISSTGAELDMGCKYDEDEDASGGRCFSFHDKLPAQVIQNRQTLFSCMEQAGFVNYPYEWWHWSYGDKYWAAVTDVSHALYGAIKLRERR